MVRYKGGIHIESEFKKYQEKAQKWDKIVTLAKEENIARSRIKEIAQERAQLLGITNKYKGKRPKGGMKDEKNNRPK